MVWSSFSFRTFEELLKCINVRSPAGCVDLIFFAPVFFLLTLFTVSIVSIIEHNLNFKLIRMWFIQFTYHVHHLSLNSLYNWIHRTCWIDHYGNPSNIGSVWSHKKPTIFSGQWVLQNFISFFHRFYMLLLH